MNRVWHAARLLPVVVGMGLLCPWEIDGGARAQPFAFTPQPGNQFELSDTVQLDRADRTVQSDLQRVKAYLADRQWDEAVETLRGLMGRGEGAVLGVTERRYVSLGTYVHLQLAGLPAEALALYRSRVDPVARPWYEQGIAGRDRRLLLRVVEQAFASSWGDNALFALGEIALESGDYASARWYWERIVPAGLPADAPRTWPGYPDTDLDLAAVRARLVLVSILEGSTARAREELELFAGLHGDARGRFAGREGNYLEALRELLAESSAWPAPKADPDWPTFAGNALRNKAAPEMVEAAEVAWRIPLQQYAVGGRTRGPVDIAAQTVAEDANATLSYHPLLADDLVLLNNHREILAIRAATGEPAWGESGPVVYRDQFGELSGAISQPSNTLGVPRFTMTLCDGKLYARMGSTVTGRSQAEAAFAAPSAIPVRSGYLVCLDMAAEGRLMWKAVPEEGWAFEGSPVADGTQVYVAMRRSDIRPQAHVACFDAQTGRRRWRRFVCGAETPAGGVYHESTHNLLTLDHRTIYYNTNLGAVAALSAPDGRLLWVSLYPRAPRGNLLALAPHWRRDVNPCLYDHGTLLVAPADSPRIFALDSGTGQLLWQTGTQVEDVVHLLGSSAEHLIASGGKLYWIGLQDETRGRVTKVWPEGPEKPGFGRGLLAADGVLWPTREKIYVFDRKTARPKKVIDLVPRGTTGGNLLVWRGRLLIATGKELIALRRYAGGSPGYPPEVTSTFALPFARRAREPAGRTIWKSTASR